MSERKKRTARLRNRQPGSWGTISTMYFDIVDKVFRESASAAGEDQTQPSRWVYAGLPMLIAGFEGFLIEHQHLLKENRELQTFAGIHDLSKVLKLYPLPDDLRRDMEALIELRNQILHPSPVPFGEPGWPDSLERLRLHKVLDGNTPQSGADVLALLANHRVFIWAVEKCAETLDVVTASDADRSWMFRQLAGNLWRVLKRPASW
jgi:hypothetical protein